MAGDSTKNVSSAGNKMVSDRAIQAVELNDREALKDSLSEKFSTSEDSEGWFSWKNRNSAGPLRPTSPSAIKNASVSCEEIIIQESKDFKPSHS